MQIISEPVLNAQIRRLWVKCPAYLMQEFHENGSNIRYFVREVLTGWEYQDAAEVQDDVEVSPELARWLFSHASELLPN